MSSSYIKNFEVGNIRLDTPKQHIIHELPLLSFGDARNTFALSLIFQSKLTGNPFYIANGYKLSIQKRIIVVNSVPQSYEDGNGTLTNLNRFNNKYAFDDGSQRFIRQLNEQYILENPDYSTEVYDDNGNILLVKDKHGNTILDYSYSDGKLISVAYKESKTVTLGYNSNGMLQTIEYTYANVTYATTFTYSDSEVSSEVSSEVIVSHYSGVDYHLTYSSGYFEVFSANAGGSYSNDMSYKATATKNATDDGFVIEKYKGNKKLDSNTYHFVSCDSYDKANILEITDFYNVKTRVQFNKGKPAYSYEMLDTMFIDYPIEHPVNQSIENVDYYPGRVIFYNNNQAVGAQGYSDGLAMLCETNKDAVGPNLYGTYHNFSGMMTVSGWLKPTINLTEAEIHVYTAGNQYIPYTITGLAQDVWTYFSVSFYLENNTFLRVATAENYINISASDFRLTGHIITSSDEFDEYKDNLTEICGALVHTDSSGNDIYIPIIDTVEYFNGEDPISKTDYPITINDIMRFKINQAIGTNTDEIYYNDGRGILPLSGDFFVRYHTPDGAVITASLKDLDIGKKQTSKGNVYVSKITSYRENNSVRIKTQSLKNNYEIGSVVYNDKLDIIETINEGIITTYARNATTGLVVEQTVTDAGNTSEMTSSAVYDANDFLVSTTDEFGIVTTYTTDPTWGVVTKSSVSNGLTVTDTFDNDCSTQKSRTFGNDTDKKHDFTYFPSGLLHTIENDTLNYTMGYTADMLSAVTKNNLPVEQMNISDDRKTITSYYPDMLNPQYNITERYDNYGRLTEIDGFITNTYDVNPTNTVYADSSGNGRNDFSVVGLDNGSGKLAASTDHITGNTTKYGYKNNKLSFATEFDAEGNEVSIESFYYDEYNRPKKRTFTYDTAGSKRVSNIVSYTANDGDPYEGDIIKSSTFKLNDVTEAYTANSFDSFKRLYMKETTLYQNKFTKNFTYNKSRIQKITDKVLNINLGTNGYTYDSMGRIVTNTYSSKNTSSNYRKYTYDQYGQLVRENNEGLDKTFVYEYNNIGNIMSVKEYDFTLSDNIEDIFPTKEYAYDSTYPDRLTNFNGSAIYYNSMGYPIEYGGRSYIWNKGKLSRIYRGSPTQGGATYEDCTFTYDAYGRRLSKSYTYDPNPASTSDYSYTYNTTYNYDNSGRLLREYCTEKYISGTTNKREFIYLYDESSIIGVLYSYNGSSPTPYYYHRNLQGDVIAIYDASGYTKAEYTYDAWGNCKVTNSTLYDLAYNNPIRYRGYYYDRETKLYYLNARYYNPEWRRFISPDDTSYLDPDTPNGLNLYAYCNNDPVNYSDPSGNFAVSLAIAGLIVGAIIGATIGGIITYNAAKDNGSEGWELFGWTALGILGGGVVGGAIGYGIGYYWPLISSFLSSSFSFTIPTFASVNTGGALAFGGGITITVSGAQIAGGTLAIGLGILMFAKSSRRSGKEMSSEHPDWVNRDMVDFDKTAQENAKDILDEKYGENNWKKGGKTEYNQIVKWITRKIFKLR